MRRTRLSYEQQSFRLLVLAAAVVATSALNCATDVAAEAPDELGTKASALFGGDRDDDTPEANVVVDVDTMCTGTLITPQIVLTASHCIQGSEKPAVPAAAACAPDPRPRINVGPYKNQFHQYANKFLSVASVTKVGTCQPPKRYGEDMALVFLAEPVTPAGLRPETRDRTPRVVPPTLQPPDRENDEFAGDVGFSGYSPFNEANNGAINDMFYRQKKIITNAYMQHTGDDAGGAYFYRTPSGWGIRGGDSGGPVFAVRSDGSRDPFAVAASGDVDSNETWWTDITWPSNKSWLLAHVTESAMRDLVATTAGMDRLYAHNDGWLAKHGKTLGSWWGKSTYQGPATRQWTAIATAGGTRERMRTASPSRCTTIAPG